MRSSLQPALETYHHLIGRDLSAAEEQLAQLQQGQRDADCLFGGRVMANSLRPTFLTERMYTDVQDTVYLIRQAFLKIASTFFNDENLLRDELGLDDWEIRHAATPTNVIRLSATARFDSFMTADSFKFVEINGEVPAGLGYLHELQAIYRSLPIFQEFERSHPVRFVSPLEHTFASLLQIYHDEFDGREETPTFAIVDRLNVPTIHEFRLIKAYLERRGFPCEICDPRELEERDGWIYANGKKIDILYRRLLMREMREIEDDCGAYLRGYAAGKTCYLNSFRTNLTHKKAVFAFLTDERYTKILAPHELAAIAGHIPWTRRMRPSRTSFRGLPIDLIEFVRKNRSHFVIKPNDGYGGAGVTLGFEASEGEWDAAIDEGLRLGSVVQEAVDIYREPFLLHTAQGWELVPLVIDLDPYVNGPSVGGCLARTSATNLANVTAGGGTLPMFILRYM